MKGQWLVTHLPIPMNLCGYTAIIDHTYLWATLCDGSCVNNIVDSRVHESTSKSKSNRHSKCWCWQWILMPITPVEGQNRSVMKMYFKMLSAKWWQYCSCLNMLNIDSIICSFNFSHTILFILVQNHKNYSYTYNWLHPNCLDFWSLISLRCNPLWTITSLPSDPRYSRSTRSIHSGWYNIVHYIEANVCTGMVNWLCTHKSAILVFIYWFVKQWGK